MSIRTRVTGVVLLACAIGASPAVAGGGGATVRPFAVSSTLDGKTVLPQRIHWVAKPGIAAAKVVEVVFLIDGKIGWVEHKPPYVYGNDGNWLVTSALEPGTHRFTVRTTTVDVRTVSKTVKARVLPAAAPPAALAGSWQRTVTKAQAGSEGTVARRRMVAGRLSRGLSQSTRGRAAIRQADVEPPAWLRTAPRGDAAVVFTVWGPVRAADSCRRRSAATRCYRGCGDKHRQTAFSREGAQRPRSAVVGEGQSDHFRHRPLRCVLQRLHDIFLGKPRSRQMAARRSR